MAAALKKRATTLKKPRRAPSRKATAKPTVGRARAKDLAERRKIGKTLDVAAFLAHHETNAASSAHWQTKE